MSEKGREGEGEGGRERGEKREGEGGEKGGRERRERRGGMEGWREGGRVRDKEVSRLKVGQKKEGMLREKSRGNGGEEKGSIGRKEG